MRAEAQRFRELVVYVAQQSQEDPRCGATKLNKILFYADFRAYETLGASISGQAYQKLENGPAPRRILPVVQELQNEGACVWDERSYYGHPLNKLTALREPDLSVFKPEEIALVREVIEDLWDLNATEVSDLSHRFAGWQASDLKEEIPYNTVFVDDPRPLSDEEHAWALQAIGEYERESQKSR
jgi:hypothetical protein